MCSRAPAISLPGELHPALEPLRFLVGKWKGQGKGVYPTIKSFGYIEEVAFIPPSPPKPMLVYTQKTRELMEDGSVGSPLHIETGYIRATPRGVELVVCDPTGLAQTYTGEPSSEPPSIVFSSTNVVGTPTAKPVTAVTRRLQLNEDGALVCEVDMAAMGLELQHHLSATLSSAADSATPAVAPTTPASEGAGVGVAEDASPLLLDVREASEFAADGGVADSINIPLGQLIHLVDEPERLPSSDRIAGASSIQLLCETGYRAKIAMQVMREYGYPAAVREGGLVALRAAAATESSDKK